MNKTRPPTARKRRTRSANVESDKTFCGSTKLTGLTLHLSAETRKKLQTLRFKSLDGSGQMPNASAVIERLINQALKNEPEMPYPTIR